MATPLKARTLSITINRDCAEAYRHLARPEHFPEWASGLAGSLRNVAGRWLAETPEGTVQIRFSEQNDFGVLDHWVHISPDVTLYIPLRLIPNGSGCELMLTLYRQADMTDEKFAADAEWVMRDLNTAKQMLEARKSSGSG